MYLRAIRALPKFFVFCTICVLLGSAWAQQQPTSSQPDGDNTKVNQRDRQPNEPTADQQKENSSDRAMAQKVRQSFVHDKSLSTYAHNVKVIAEGGKVTLKGPVRSEDEKNALAAKAAEIAGAGNINNQLDVVPKHD
jgi:hyperosmotically inducible protein